MRFEPRPDGSEGTIQADIYFSAQSSRQRKQSEKAIEVEPEFGVLVQELVRLA